ncbi:MAG: hypothetical protein NTV82_03740 [Candidatus Aminicenantes bacterium]|nr:hypothetical protein [Candidatus Aminicenantes bacterium]
MKQRTRWALSVATLCLISLSLAAQEAEVDISACRGIYTVLKAMRDGAPKEQVSSMLETLLDTRPYQVMFKHYNRSWRPNHLPKPVFKRMILSLQFAEEYSAGENERADTMRARWTKYYPNLSPYEKQLRQLEGANLSKLINDAVRFAQEWLPPEWKIPKFYFPVIPNGGSPAFALENTQGYDFLQLAQGTIGEIDLNWLAGTVSHESHHLGMRSTMPGSLSAADAMAFRVVSLCVAEGVATYFISGPPPGRAPAFKGTSFHVFTGELAKAWNDQVSAEEEILQHQTMLLDKAMAGLLTEEAFNAELREYWLNGVVGRAYTLGAEMFGAIYTAFGKEGVFAAIQNPRRLFELYNAAIDAKPEALKRCVRVPDKAVKQALAIGRSVPLARGALPLRTQRAGTQKGKRDVHG